MNGRREIPASVTGNRRLFLTAVLGTAVFWGTTVLQGCNSKAPAGGAARQAISTDSSEPPSVRVFQKAFHAMGTIFTFSAALHGDDAAEAERAVDAAAAEITRVEREMSPYIENSPLSQVNRNAGIAPVRVPQELLRIIEEANDISRRTEGKFDISFGAVGRLWKFDKAQPSLPDKAELAKARQLVDYRSIVTDAAHRTVFLKKEGMSIGLGAIAKGYGVDRASEVLRSRGFTDFIVYGGGDIFISGSKGGAAWRVGVQDPRDRTRYFADFDVREAGAVVTSGDYEKFFVLDGRRYHHIIDPADGYPARGMVSATIVAKNTALADALATGVFILGIERGMRLIESDSAVEGILVDEALRPHVSSGLKDRTNLRPITGAKEAP